MNTIFRIALLMWVVGYLFLACSPILSGDLVGGTIALFGGLLLFIPWVVGIVILGVLIWVTDPSRMSGPPRPPTR